MNSTMRTCLRGMLGVVMAAAVAFAAAPGADARPGPVTASWKLPAGSYALAVGLNAVWSVNADEFHDSAVFRLDPSTHALKQVASLPFPAGDIELGFGSVWVSDYYGNAVWRLATNGRVQAEVPVGLQPEQMHAAFGSLWVSNHHGASLTRIDPTTNTVTDTVTVGQPDTFRNGPQGVTSDGTNIYVGSSNLQALQSVAPSTDAVTTPASIDDAFCGQLLSDAGYIWSIDRCNGVTWQLSTDGSVAQALPSTGMPFGETATSDGLWIGEDTGFDPNTGAPVGAVLEERDPSTGALERSISIGGDGEDVVAGFGALWVYDGGLNALERVSL